MPLIIAITVTAIAGAVGTHIAVRRLIRRRETIAWQDADRPGQLIDVGGLAVHYIEQGAGPAVVMVHGFGGHTFSFRKLIPDLARDYRAIALDLKGFGYTERPKRGDYSLGAQAKLVLDTMDAFDVRSATLIGHSMGGEVAMRVAALAPQRVERLILAGSISGDRIPTLPPLPGTKLLLALLGRLFGERILRRSVYDRATLTPEMRRAYRAPLAIKGAYDAIWQVIRQFRRDKTVDFKRITQPVLILWASHDRIVPRWVLGRLRKRLPQAEVETIERAGHLLLEERSQACLNAIRSFLRDQPQSAPLRAAEPVDIAQPAS